MPRRPAIPVRTWREPIDGKTFAAVAFAEFTAAGWYRAASFFLIVQSDNGVLGEGNGWEWREAAKRHFEQQLERHCHGFLPYVCRTFERE